MNKQTFHDIISALSISACFFKHLRRSGTSVFVFGLWYIPKDLTLASVVVLVSQTNLSILLLLSGCILGFFSSEILRDVETLLDKG